MSRRNDDGASLVEVGLVLPVLLMLAIGLSEVGFLVIDYVTVINAARSGARTGAAAADTPGADDIILNVVEEAACNLRFSDTAEVRIYRAQADGSMPPLPSPLVNVYRAAGGQGSLLCGNSNHGLTPDINCCSWDPASRDRVPPGLDSLGVQVIFSHTAVTGLFPFPTANWTEDAVMQLEPDTKGTQ